MMGMQPLKGDMTASVSTRNNNRSMRQQKMCSSIDNQTISMCTSIFTNEMCKKQDTKGQEIAKFKDRFNSKI